MSATAAAAQVQPGSRVRWDRLERAAFAAHPAVLEEHASAPSTRNSWVALGLILGGIPYILGALSPIGGVAIFVGGRFQTWEPDAEDVVPIAGLFFIWTVLSLLVSIVRWVIKGRPRQKYFELQAWLAIVLGAVAGGGMAFRGSRESFEQWPLWVIPVAVAIILAAGFLLALVFANTSRGSGLPPKSLKLLTQRRAQVAQLPDDERAAISRDIAACIDDLERRRLISEAEAERARGAELGALALRMSV